MATVAYTKPEKSKFAANPTASLEYRKGIEEVLHTAFLRLFTDSQSRIEGAKQLQELIREKLASKPGLFDLIRPEWPVGCKRLGASPGYLEAIVKENVDIITSGIQKVTSEGIIDNNGVVRPVDAIVCATGFDT